MSTKTNNLYPHPFSKAYWRDAVSELKDVHMMVFAALMIALRLVLKQFAIPITPFLKINVSFFITDKNRASSTDSMGNIIRFLIMPGTAMARVNCLPFM